jgi:hypothetical protein
LRAASLRASAAFLRAALAAAALRFFFSIWACERDGHEGVEGRTPAREPSSSPP